jgi:hypothetical protein
MCAICVGENIRNYIQYFISLVLYSLCAFLLTVFVLCVLLSSMCICYTVCLYICFTMYLCICYTVCLCICYTVFLCICYTCCFTLDAGPLARSQYPEGPATGHLDTGFSRFPCVYKPMLTRSPSFPVATTCSSCSPPHLNFPVTYLIFYV